MLRKRDLIGESLFIYYFLLSYYVMLSIIKHPFNRQKGMDYIERKMK